MPISHLWKSLFYLWFKCFWGQLCSVVFRLYGPLLIWSRPFLLSSLHGPLLFSVLERISVSFLFHYFLFFFQASGERSTSIKGTLSYICHWGRYIHWGERSTSLKGTISYMCHWWRYIHWGERSTSIKGTISYICHWWRYIHWG